MAVFDELPEEKILERSVLESVLSSEFRPYAEDWFVVYESYRELWRLLAPLALPGPHC